MPPCHYDKLRTVLNEMELKGIIRKFQSEYASQLVLVWKKNGDLRICTDFRWLNAKTVQDAHPLPHQSDALAALGGNVFFSTMDLTSGFYRAGLGHKIGPGIFWSRRTKYIYISTVSHRSEYTPHIFVNILLYLFM